MSRKTTVQKTLETGNSEVTVRQDRDFQMRVTFT